MARIARRIERLEDDFSSSEACPVCGWDANAPIVYEVEWLDYSDRFPKEEDVASEAPNQRHHRRFEPKRCDGCGQPEQEMAPPVKVDRTSQTQLH